MRRLILVLGLIAVASVAAAAEDNCGGAATQSEMNRCADKAYRDVDAKLNAIYQQITGRLRASDYARPNALKALVAAQRAWTSFRDAECAFVGSKTTGGSINPAIMSSCLAGLTDQRVNQLKKYLNCEDGDLSCPVPALAAPDGPAEIPFPGSNDTIVVPANSPVKYSGLNGEREATFEGRVLLTGTYFYGDHPFNDSGDQDARKYEFSPQAYIVVDDEIAAMPHFSKRHGREKFTIFIANPSVFAKSVVPKINAERVRCRNCQASTGRVSIWVDEFRAEIACDQAVYSARFESIAKPAQSTMVKKPETAC